MMTTTRSPEIDDLFRHFDRVTMSMDVFQKQALVGLLAISLYSRDDLLTALGSTPVYDDSEKPLL